MTARTAYYFLLAAGALLTGAGHFFVGPFLIIIAVVYRERIVAAEEKASHDPH